MAELITAAWYWILVALWIAILALYIAAHRTMASHDHAIAVLLAVLIIDACRTLFESIYFGFYFTSEYGFISPQFVEVLARPYYLVVPKLLNVGAAVVILFILIRSWLPSQIRDRRKSLVELTRAASVFRNAREGIVVVSPEGRISDVNQAFLELSGYERQDVLGQGFAMHKSGRHTERFYQDMWSMLASEGEWSGLIWNTDRMGNVYPCNLRIDVLENEAGELLGYVGLYTDQSAYLAQQQKLESIVQFDTLTGLPNRVLLADRIDQALVQSRRRGTTAAILFLDLDDFRAVNDRVGPQAGDTVLIAIAEQVGAVLREIDTLGRFGGDEFVVVLPDLASAADAQDVSARILEAIDRPIEIETQSVQLSASLGFTLYPADDGDSEQLVRHASQAMYEAKQDPARPWRRFDPKLDKALEARGKMLAEIHQGLERGEFELHYQPIICLRTGIVTDVEALLRWRIPDGGYRQPNEFLPATRNHPQAIDLGDWVIGQALTQLELWSAEGVAPRVSINVDVYHLQQSDFPARLAALLRKHAAIDPSRVELEVLESSSMDNVEAVAAIMARCSTLGVSFAIDDFGTGYSSLTYLRRLPVKRVKIDQSFVRDMLDDTDDAAVVRNVISMAQNLGRTVIAEGVETDEHLNALIEQGCDLAQGYGIARPMPAHELPAWNKAWGMKSAAWSQSTSGDPVP